MVMSMVSFILLLDESHSRQIDFEYDQEIGAISVNPNYVFFFGIAEANPISNRVLSMATAAWVKAYSSIRVARPCLFLRI